MPTPEQEIEQQAQSLEGMPEPQEQAEQQVKTIAVRVQEGLHAQLSFIAQLSGTSISERSDGPLRPASPRSETTPN